MVRSMAYIRVVIEIRAPRISYAQRSRPTAESNRCFRGERLGDNREGHEEILGIPTANVNTGPRSRRGARESHLVCDVYVVSFMSIIDRQNRM
jgi:hypothetical protein